MGDRRHPQTGLKTNVGYRDLYDPDVFSDSTNLPGLDVTQYTSPTGGGMTTFNAAVTGVEDFVLFQVCVAGEGGAAQADLDAAIANLKASVPGAPLYLMPLDVSGSSSGCARSGYNTSVSLIAASVANGDALMGPEILPLYDATEVQGGQDLCHPNDAGATRAAGIVDVWVQGLN